MAERLAQAQALAAIGAVRLVVDLGRDQRDFHRAIVIQAVVGFIQMPVQRVEVAGRRLGEVRALLQPYRRVLHDVAVVPATYVPLRVALLVCVLPDYLRGHVEAALRLALGSGRLPDGRLGFFHPDNLTFGEGIYLSRLVAAAHGVEGVEGVQVTRLQRLFEAPNQEIARGVLPLGTFEVAQLDNDPSFPEHGRLALTLKGGR